MIAYSLRTYLVAAALAAAVPPSAKADETAIEQTIRTAFAEGALPGLHAVMVQFEGDTVAEIYFSGEDERWGKALGDREHGPDTLHDLRSVTKSIVGLLYGIALEEGLVPPPDSPLLAQFPEYPDLGAEAARARITIGHALSMKMGTDWNEELPYTDPANSEIAMELAPDRYRFVLDRPMVKEPGEQWTYNGGATAVIARLIARGAGQPIDVYANRVLFEPLGISDFEWVGGKDGEPSAASGLRLTLRDLTKIGQMISKGGRWNERQIVPESWLSQSFTPRETLRTGLRYGYHWWLAQGDGAPRGAAAFGNGGQRLTVNLDSPVVVAAFAGNYNDPNAWRIPVDVIVKHVRPWLNAQRSKPD